MPHWHRGQKRLQSGLEMDKTGKIVPVQQQLTLQQLTLAPRLSDTMKSSHGTSGVGRKASLS